MRAMPAPSANLFALPDGTELVGDYRIRRVLGAGGFGITYLADEKALDRLVTIKEYFPADFAARQRESAVARSRDTAADYQWGLDRFIEEAQTLARFDHPNIVRVHRYFRTNNTGYMVLKFEDGGSLKSWLDGLGRAPRQDELDRLIQPLLDALEIIHAADFLHRDIAPDNVMLRRDGSPVLIDFGSARGAIAGHSRTVSALVKPGYSPYEQYATSGANQGPWTDIYALGATLYHAVTGSRPPDAPSRVVEDEYVPAREVALSSYRSGFLDAIDMALRIEVRERPRSIAEWRSALLAPEPEPKPSLPRLRLPAAAHAGPARKNKTAAAPAAKAADHARAAVSEPARAEVPASPVPPPPDAPQRQGQLLDFIEALEKRGPPPLRPARQEGSRKSPQAPQDKHDDPAAARPPAAAATASAMARRRRAAAPLQRLHEPEPVQAELCQDAGAADRAGLAPAVAPLARGPVPCRRGGGDRQPGGRLPGGRPAFGRPAAARNRATPAAHAATAARRAPGSGRGGGRRRCGPLDRLGRRRRNLAAVARQLGRAGAHHRAAGGAGHRLRRRRAPRARRPQGRRHRAVGPGARREAGNTPARQRRPSSRWPSSAGRMPSPPRARTEAWRCFRSARPRHRQRCSTAGERRADPRRGLRARAHGLRRPRRQVRLWTAEGPRVMRTWRHRDERPQRDRHIGRRRPRRGRRRRRLRPGMA